MAPYSGKTYGEEVARDFKEQIRGKVILTTGVSPGGLGATFVETLAKFEPKLLILAGRDTSKVDTTVEAVKKISAGRVQARALELDLASQEQIRKAAAEVNGYGEAIDVLVNNAGLMAASYSVTKDGIESQFGVNHIGHFLFTNLIMDKILASGAGARVVSVSSDGYRLSPIRFDDWKFDGGKTYQKWAAYGQAKTANMLFAVCLAKKLGRSKGLVALSLHPGVIMTKLARHLEQEDFVGLAEFDKQLGNADGWRTELPLISPEQGVATHIRSSFDPSLTAQNGSYLEDCNVFPPEQVRCWGRDEVEAEKLWALSEEIVGQKFSY